MTNNYSKDAFIRLALACNVLKFGQFTLKSGRQSPYFFNAGLFYDGEALRQLGHFYAQAILDAQIPCNHLFGPAYKGLPLATTTAIALAGQGINVKVSFNRKEVKDHGEGGQLIGAPIKNEVVMIDDVITAGTAFRESKHLIEHNGGQLSAVVIALNRCERGIGNTSTLDEIEAQGIKVLSIITLHDLMHFLEAEKAYAELDKLKSYQKEYGV